jgi:hypothetical protein
MTIKQLPSSLAREIGRLQHDQRDTLLVVFEFHTGSLAVMPAEMWSTFPDGDEEAWDAARADARARRFATYH